MKDVIVAGSLLSADLSDVSGEFEKFTDWGLEVMHIDVMDGHFAPNLTFGPDVFKSLKGKVKIPVDIHMMVEKPMEYVERFADIFNVGEFESGRNWYGIHVELYLDEGVLEVEKISGDLIRISELGFQTTIVVNPDTSVYVLDPLLEAGLVDKVLVMTVWPGFSGQEMIEECLKKIAELSEKLSDTGVFVSVDGGVNDGTISKVHEAGSDFIVSGSYLMGVLDKGEFDRRLDRLSL